MLTLSYRNTTHAQLLYLVLYVRAVHFYSVVSLVDDGAVRSRADTGITITAAFIVILIPCTHNVYKLYTSYTLYTIREAIV